MQQINSVWGKWVVALLALGALGVVFLNMLIDNRPKGEVQNVEGYVPWEKESVKLVESLPLQDGGRIKPFSTFASFKMLQLHGARSMKVEGKGGKEFKIKPTEWLMDTLFRPKLAVNLPTFRVDNSQVLEAISVKTKGRRDRYSYTEIEPGIAKLMELAQSYEPIEKKQRDPMQQQAIDLAYNIRNYQSLLRYFSFARSGNYSIFGLSVLPPKNASDEKWLTAGNAIMEVMTMDSKDPVTAITDIKFMGSAARAVPVSEMEFRKHFTTFKEQVVQRAVSRGEMSRIDMEVSYFKKDYFLYAIAWFLMGTLCALTMWGIGTGIAAKILSWATLGFSVIGAAYCVIAIVIRCLIMHRPPVGNLYDTIIFIGTTGVIFALIIEWMSRKRFALGLAPILGLGLIMLARRYEVGDAGDHLDPLVAVLDSNFWLATHVITITLGYSAGLLAAMLSCGYVLMRGLNLDGGNKELRRSLTKAVYGCICLTVFLSLVGTVLGGIWANYSWGRFWGWDPKENGALMIVLWTLAILHARLGGIINEWGLHLTSLFTACIVAFSWWHVNFLGVGLHNYGFTTGKDTIWIFYGVMMVFILFGTVAMLVEYFDKQAERAAKPKAIEDLETLY
jgi:ABC-type transport system involved in cytochrome c biogenesis permease subunit